MSSPVSVGDFITIISLGHQIYEKCFTRAQAADQRYLQFGEYILGFSQSLERLKRVLSNVEQQRQLRPDVVQVNSTLKPLPDLTGDFAKTLRDCERLLGDNVKFERNAAGFVDNVRWWLGVEAQVESLKQRIRFHTTKILLITKPVEFQLLSDLQKDIWEVRRVVEEIKGLLDPSTEQPSTQQNHGSTRLPPVPSELEALFEAAVNERPNVHLDLKHFPLKEGFDALVFHFAESTVQFVSTEFSNQRTPELTQYLNLIKSRWILQRLTESSYFVRDSLWARCFIDIEDNIIREYRRFDLGQLTSPSIDVIARLQSHCFSIWAADQDEEIVPTLLDERPSEEKLLEIAFPKPKSQNSRKQLLVVFRKSDHELRLVVTTKDDQNEMFYEAEAYEISMNYTCFIPLYAAPGSTFSTGNNNLLFCNSQGQGHRAYSIEELDDVHKLQQAVTGYNDQCALEHLEKFGAWQRKSTDLACEAAPKNEHCGRYANPIPCRRPSTKRTSLSSVTLAENVAAAAKGSVVYGKSGPAVLFQKPESGMLVVYTMIKEEWTFLYFELNDDVYFCPTSCHCNSCKNSRKTMCTRVIIQARGGLKIKRHSANAKDGVNKWDLALLRKPQHPKAGNSVSILPAQYLCLAFDSVDDKLQFQVKFKDAQKLRVLDERKYWAATSPH